METKAEPDRARGVYAAILTPREHASTEASGAKFLEYLDRVTSAGVDGLVLFGSTGDFVHYDLEERMRAVSLSVKRSRVPVLVNVSHSSLQGAVTLAEQAAETGVAGVLLMPPYFYRYEDSEIEQFYLDFVSEIGNELPVYLYSLPSFTNALSAALVDRLLRSGSFAGIKESGGAWQAFEKLIDLKRDVRFQALVGNEVIYLSALRAGADGIVSGIAAAVPELPLAISRAVTAQDSGIAEDLALRLDQFLSWVNRLPVTVALKCTAKHRGWLPLELAVPLGPTTWATVRELEDWLSDWLPQTLARCSESAAVHT